MIWHTVELKQDGGLLHVRREVSHEQFGLRLKVDNRSAPKMIYSGKDRDFSLRTIYFIQRVERELNGWNIVFHFSETSDHNLLRVPVQ